MKSATQTNDSRRRAGFTLAEVLAALLFLAIVIPASVGALHVASQAGSVSVRKAVAARVADKILNEALATGTWNQPQQSGTVIDHGVRYRWSLRNEAWSEDTMQLVTAEVGYSVQGRDYSVQMSTLANSQ